MQASHVQEGGESDSPTQGVAVGAGRDLQAQSSPLAAQAAQGARVGVIRGSRVITPRDRVGEVCSQSPLHPRNLLPPPPISGPGNASFQLQLSASSHLLPSDRPPRTLDREPLLSLGPWVPDSPRPSCFPWRVLISHQGCRGCGETMLREPAPSLRCVSRNIWVHAACLA